VIVQDELSQFHLLTGTGVEIDRTDRTLVNGISKFTGLCGIPALHTEGGTTSLYVPCEDGLLRTVRYGSSSNSLEVRVASAYMDASARIVQICDVGGESYAVIGAVRPILFVVKLSTGEVVDRFPPTSEPPLAGTPVLIERYSAQASPVQLLVANGAHLTLLELSAAGKLSRAASRLDVELPQARPEIDALEIFGTAPQDYVYAALPHGRLFLLNRADLSFTRTSASIGIPSGASPLPWPANLSLGHVFGVTTYDAPADGAGPLLIAHDNRTPCYSQGGTDRFRLVSLDPVTGDFQPQVQLAGLIGNIPSAAGLQPRGLLIDPDASGRKTFFPWENGAMIGSKKYQTYDPGGAAGGYLHEYSGSEQSAVRIENFSLGAREKDPDLDYWPVVGPDKRNGQFSTIRGFSDQIYLGHVVRTGLLPDASGVARPHVVVGTCGGFVYAIDPSQPYPNGLRYFSWDLGWNVIGLDIADVDGDGVNEVIAGTWLDKGSSKDYREGRTDRSHGHLYVLKCKPASGSSQFEWPPVEISLGGDLGTLSSGVFGVKVDDIDANGEPEMWVGDAVGHLYALRFNRSSKKWEAFYRSPGLGVYPGVYNNIYPIKDADGHTVMLVVFTPGYVYRFAVKWSVVR
jgi:hypothetical protein